MNLAKQSTAKTILIGPVLDADGVAVTSLTASSFKITKNGTVGDLNVSSTVTHNHTGHYLYAANGGDLDTLGVATISINSTTNGMAPVSLQVVTANIYDTFCSTDKLEVDLLQIGGDAQSATDLKDFADAGYDPGTNKVQGVVLTDTVTTYTGNTVQTGDSFARIGATGSGLTTLAQATELALVPKSTGSDTFNATCVGNIKSGLTTTAMLPTNFVDMAITATTGRVTVGTNADKTGYGLAADQSSVTVGTVTNTGTVTGNVNGSVGSVTGAVGSVTGAVGSVTGAVGSVSGNVGGSVASVTAGVTLANGAHGGAAATVTAKSIAVTNSDVGGVAVTLTGSGTGNSHALRLASTNGSSISATAGSHAITVNSSAGDGLQIVGATNDINADITGTLATCTTVTNMLTAAAVNAEVDTALNTAIPTNPTAASINDYIKRMKRITCNKFEVDEDDGDTRTYDDAGTLVDTIAAGFTSLSTITKREKLA